MTPEPKLREGCTIVCGVILEHRDPMRDEYVISGLDVEKLKALERLIYMIADTQAEIKRLLGKLYPHS